MRTWNPLDDSYVPISTEPGAINVIPPGSYPTAWDRENEEFRALREEADRAIDRCNERNYFQKW